ncbi:inositol monophosphatase [candidate division WOR-3 bacterium]|nr:inositol monophosphatase [candidate division WOR-3 bacterium]
MNFSREDLRSTLVKAGDHLLTSMNSVNVITEKSKFDYVTEKDIETERFLKQKLQTIVPGSSFLGEEDGFQFSSSPFRWIVDPLDGTTNYIHSFPIFSISTALEENGKIIFGAIYFPLLKEYFWASEGEGAYLNDKKISVSQIESLEGGLFATGFPFRAHERIDRYLASFRSVFEKASGIRRCGSAALDLCFVACGRFDGFWEDNLSPWDIAAGELIVKEAGGTVEDFFGGDNPHEKGSVICSNKKIFTDFFKTAAVTYTNYKQGR